MLSIFSKNDVVRSCGNVFCVVMYTYATAERHHKQRLGLRNFEERCRRQKQLAEEFAVNLPYGKRPKRVVIIIFD